MPSSSVCFTISPLRLITYVQEHQSGSSIPCMQQPVTLSVCRQSGGGVPRLRQDGIQSGAPLLDI